MQKCNRCDSFRPTSGRGQTRFGPAELMNRFDMLHLPARTVVVAIGDATSAAADAGVAVEGVGDGVSFGAKRSFLFLAGPLDSLSSFAWRARSKPAAMPCTASISAAATGFSGRGSARWTTAAASPTGADFSAHSCTSAASPTSSCSAIAGPITAWRSIWRARAASPCTSSRKGYFRPDWITLEQDGTNAFSAPAARRASRSARKRPRGQSARSAAAGRQRRLRPARALGDPEPDRDAAAGAALSALPPPPLAPSADRDAAAG